GEINFKVRDCQKTIDLVFAEFASSNPRVDKMDGISADFGDWRFNIRASNTEPLLRLNVETQGTDAKNLLVKYTKLISTLIEQ
ncbi:phosphomannomutase CpsG, partial [Bacillus thuringiensis]|nr:phosphomannomutase CpsG [Bacillus thuringiensis]